MTASNSGSATLVIYDAVGASDKFTLTVSGGGTPIALSSTAPSNVTVQKGAAAAQYTVNGGVAPYTATSSDLAIAAAQLTGNLLTISGVGVGNAKVAVIDAVGTLLNIAVGVNGEASPQLYTTAPPNLKIAAGVSQPYSVQGGRSPYTVSTSNAGVASAAITNGNVLTLTGVSTGWGRLRKRNLKYVKT